MRRFTKGSLVVIALVVICFALGFSLLFTARIARWFYPYRDQQLLGDSIIDPNWREITPQSPIQGTQQRQMIALDLDPAIHYQEEGNRLVLPDGSVVRVEVVLVGSDGKTYELTGSGFFLGNDGTFLACFYRTDLPKNLPFTRVRIRSSQELPCKRIFWRDYNSWEAESPF